MAKDPKEEIARLKGIVDEQAKRISALEQYRDKREYEDRDLVDRWRNLLIETLGR